LSQTGPDFRIAHLHIIEKWPEGANMSDDQIRELETALAAVSLASTICRNVQASVSPEAMEKEDRSPVTVADYASQAVICRTLRDAFPDAPIVAEEDARELRSGENALFLERIVRELAAADVSAGESEVLDWIDAGNHDGTASRFWTLDPIDGTKGFLRQDQFAVSLALIVEGDIQVAALACPNLSSLDAWDNARGIVFSAVRGQGAQVRPLDLPGVTPHTVRVSSTSSTAEARMCESFESGHSAHDQSALIREKLGITQPPVRMDSQAKYGAVARGEADLYLRLPTRKDYIEKIWDHAGGVLVVEEAGGRVTDIDGQPLDFTQGTGLKNNRGVLVTNGLLHDAMLEAVASFTDPA
jgi:3'(2'), 5'-bisphosphate nucleotidase